MMTTIHIDLSLVKMRRFFLRKRRCFLLFVSCCLIITFLLAWFPLLFGRPGSPSPVEPIVFTMHPVEPKEPKFNVLEPPKGIDQDSNKLLTDNQMGSNLKPEKLEEAHKLQSNATAKNNTVVISAVRVFQNQSEDIEVVKNKTLSQLGVLGGKEEKKTIPKVIFIKTRWNLTVSFEDIGNIMKDTSFLNKMRPLNLSGPMLTSTRNRTSNFSLSMPAVVRMGYCDCWERYCFCCVQLVNKQLHLNNKTCANFTFISKSHALDITFSIDAKQVYSGVISADAPPLLCMGSIPTVADMCIHFFNMTYRVDRMGLHKSQILGCTDVSLNIYNKTISVFPVDCFQIPGDPNHHPKQEHIILPNFVP